MRLCWYHPDPSFFRLHLHLNQPSIPLAPLGSGSTVVIGRSSSTMVLWVPISSSVPQAISSVLALQTSCVTLALCLLGFTRVFTSHGSTSVSQISGSILLPPSIDSTMGPLPGSSQACSVVFASPTPPLPFHYTKLLCQGP